MSEINSNSKETSKAKMTEINKVEGFNPLDFIEKYPGEDDNTEIRNYLPVKYQIAWFRLKYPTGKIAVSLKKETNCFIATAKVYPDYKDSPDSFLAEASAARGKSEDVPSVSPREWAQTAAIGKALTYAGFGLQFDYSGAKIEPTATDEFAFGFGSNEDNENLHVNSDGEIINNVEKPKAELTDEELFLKASDTECTVSKFKGRKMGELLRSEPGFIVWMATKYTGDPAMKETAKILCEYANKHAA